VLVILLKGKIMPRIKKANPTLNPNNPDYINYLYGTSGSTPDYIKQKNSPDPFRPYSYSTGMNNNAQWNRDDYNRGQSAPLKQPKPRKQTPASGYIKQDAWTPDYITNRAYGAMEPDMMEQLMYMYNQMSDGASNMYNQMSNGASNLYDLRLGGPSDVFLQMNNIRPGGIDEFLDDVNPSRRRETRDTYNWAAIKGLNPTAGRWRTREERTPGYISSNFSNPVSKRKKPTKRTKY
jgi:hypothetical protein